MKLLCVPLLPSSPLSWSMSPRQKMMLVFGTKLPAPSVVKLTLRVPSCPMAMMLLMMRLMSAALVPSCPLPWLIWQSETNTAQNQASSTKRNP